MSLNDVTILRKKTYQVKTDASYFAPNSVAYYYCVLYEIAYISLYEKLECYNLLVWGSRLFNDPIKPCICKLVESPYV